MIFNIRPAIDDDWPAILEMADRVLPGASADNRHWLQNRQNFDAARYTRRHYIARLDSEANLSAYAALEEGPDRKQFRLFLILPQHFLPELGEQLLLRLSADLAALEAEKVWAWEDADDPLVAFLLAYGFEARTRFNLPDGRDSLFLAQELRPTTG